jgi:Nif-specific regulatory protein
MRLSSSEAKVLPDPPLNGVGTPVDRSSDTRAAGQSGAHHRECVELGARHLAPVVDRLLLQERLDEGDDPTRMLRAQLRLDNVIGRSEAMAAVFREVAIAARSAKTVLLTGQSGTGKTQIARVIHENSPRAKHRFVDITCGNIPESLFLNNLFGYRKGAFTGADRDYEGLVAAAEHGTLFLDDIDSVSRDGQAGLLQLLQSKQYYPLGQTTPVKADIRVIAGSHVDLQAAVEKGQFRQDLLFRLDVVTIRLPALEERGTDIRHLAEALCADAWRAEGLAARPLSRDALRAIEAANWPGNVRELEHRIGNAVDYAKFENAMQIERRHVFPSLPCGASAPDGALTYQEAMRECQARVVRDALERTNGNVSEAARILFVSRTYLYDLIKVHDIKIEHK